MQVIENDGTRRTPEIYSPEKMDKAFQDKNVREIRVFHMRKGMRIEIQGSIYKVIAVRPNGKITLKEMGTR